MSEKIKRVRRTYFLNNNMHFRLPTELQLTKISGKTGRTTFSSLAMNNGQSAEATSVATKHRDPKTLLGYVAADEGLLMAAARGIGAAVIKSAEKNKKAGTRFVPSDFSDEDDDEDDEECCPPPPRQTTSVSSFSSSSGIAERVTSTAERADGPPAQKKAKITTHTFQKRDDEENASKTVNIHIHL